MKESEARGLTHWLLYTDREAVYAYNVIRGNGVVSKVLSGLQGVSNLAIDKNKGYLFVAQNSENTDKAKVDRYDLSVSLKSNSTAEVLIKETSKIEVYKGKRIAGLSIDDD